jgi:hypothetical protein
MNGLRKRCFKSLCKICAIRGVLPTQYALKSHDLQRSEDPDYIGGFGIVWKGKFGDMTVAIKRLLVNVAHLEKLKEVRHFTQVGVDQLLRLMAEILPRSDHMEKAFKPEHSTLARRVHTWLGTRHGLRVDGKRKHPTIPSEEPARK